MPRQDCMWCTERVSEHRIYFGVVGPFCNADCREEWLRENPAQDTREPREPAPGVGREMRIGASLVVRLIRVDYQTDGIDKAIATGRACFDNGDGTYGLTDGQIIAIARGEATLRGWSPPGVDYLDEPCKTCFGKGRVNSTKNNPGAICLTCEGDCFHPPVAESRAKYEPDGKRPKGAL